MPDNWEPRPFPDGNHVDGEPRFVAGALATEPRSEVPDPGDFSVRIDEGAAETVVVLRGEADLANASMLTDALAHTSSNGHNRRVVFDLAALTFVDAAFVGVIAGCHQSPHASQVILRAPSPFVTRFLTVIEWDHLIEAPTDPPLSDRGVPARSIG